MLVDYAQLNFVEDDWMKDSLCKGAGSNLFFPDEKTAAASVYNFAKLICEQCPVQRQCLMYAVKNNIHDGMWGGLSPNERKGFGTIDLGNVADYEMLLGTEAVAIKHKQTGGAGYLSFAAQELGVTYVTVRRRLMRLNAYREMEQINEEQATASE